MTSMMNESYIVFIKRDVYVVDVPRSQCDFMMSDAIVFFDDRLATIFADDITVRVDTI